MASQSTKARGAPLTGGALWAAGVLLALANFVAVLDLSIANVSVPNISGALGASTSQGVWIITSYAVAEAITVPLTGWLAGRFGAVRTFATALIGFGLASALCGMAPSLGFLVAFRVIQGVTGGPLMALSQTLLLQIFPPKQQPAAMGLWAVTTLVAPVCGPVLGGYLCDTFGWGSIFMVNVPVAILAGVLVWRTLSRYEGETKKARFDSVGLGLLIVWIAALQILLDLGKDRDWFASPLIVTLAVVAALGFAAFMIWELTEKNPIVNLRVFRHRGFSASMVTLTLTMGAFFATNVLTPLWLQSNMGYTATWAGYITGLIGILAIVSAPITAQVMTKTDPRRILFAGVAWLAVTTFMRSHGLSQMTFWQIGVWLFVAGAAMPMFFLPVTTVALGAVNPEETADASGLLNFLRTIAGAVATSIVSTVWENNATRNHADLAATMPGAQTTVDSLTGPAMNSAAALGTVNDLVGGQAVMLATNQLFLACAVVFAIAAALVWITPRPTRAVDASAAH
ncbi:DHA2 family efflux MFS transporter permease subunit [Phenylobacterium sp.]|uniref:DHA2 family efflux MFS transporter permease subunit n=1 Tax=Phenylobacterium sp. TaxID=1871053 RepID=UPI002CA0CCF5|nr:DHA2 family efflux MFS transporter permease subunit [Phenylobacterium sp.]HLZ74773.1 DHA2 family efflux MFS transporter permease subunit [Phenylobacterium sp.]